MLKRDLSHDLFSRELQALDGLFSREPKDWAQWAGFARSGATGGGGGKQVNFLPGTKVTDREKNPPKSPSPPPKDPSPAPSPPPAPASGRSGRSRGR